MFGCYQIYKLEMEQKKVEEDALVYNWLQQQLKLSPAYKKVKPDSVTCFCRLYHMCQISKSVRLVFLILDYCCCLLNQLSPICGKHNSDFPWDSGFFFCLAIVLIAIKTLSGRFLR